MRIGRLEMYPAQWEVKPRIGMYRVPASGGGFVRFISCRWFVVRCWPRVSAPPTEGR